MATIEILYKGTTEMGFGEDFLLRPGRNEVPEKAWAKWSNDKRIKAWMSDGVLAELQPPSVSEAKSKPKAEPKSEPKAEPKSEPKAEANKAG